MATLDPPLKIPSCILPHEAGLGALFQGGFKAVVNVDFLKKEGVTHIVNTAKGLESQFGPRYTVSSCGHTWPPSHSGHEFQHAVMLSFQRYFFLYFYSIECSGAC